MSYRVQLITRTALSVVALLILALGPSSALAGTVAEGYCPVTTSEKVDSTIFVDYQGQRVYFCCNDCRRDFLADPEKFAANLSGTVSGEEQHQAEQNGHDSEDAHSHDEPATSASNRSQENPRSGATEAHAEEPSEEEAGHDHSTDHDSDSKVVLFLGKFHPMVTHFPIALVLSALFLTFLSVVVRRSRLEQTGVLLIYLAAPAAIVTALLGLAAGTGANYPSFLIDYFLWHRVLGSTTAALTILAAVAGWRWRKSEKKSRLWVYRALLVLNSIVIAITGHLGATLVFGPEHFSV